MQHLVDEYFCWRLVAEALARGVIVRLYQLRKALIGHFRQVGLARQHASHASDGVLDAALLPGGVGVAEEGLDAQVVEAVVTREFGAIVESDGLAPGWRQDCEQVVHGSGDGLCRLAGGTRCQ